MCKFSVVLITLLVACSNEDVEKSISNSSDNGSSQDCDPSLMIRIYPDSDSDGYGDATSEGILTCSEHEGFVVDNSDCADQDDRAHPQQTEQFSTAIIGTAGYDFNCDSEESRALTNYIDCASIPRNECGGILADSWFGEAVNVPKCGETGLHLDACQWVGSTSSGHCSPVVQELKQSCN